MRGVVVIIRRLMSMRVLFRMRGMMSQLLGAMAFAGTEKNQSGRGGKGREFANEGAHWRQTSHPI